ncbi:MAG: TrmH family RNA methyltransferase [Acidimicrobiia bacterium]
MQPVRTHRNKQVVDAARLHRGRHRRERGLTLVEGPDLLRDVIAAGAEMVELFAIEPWGDRGATLVDQRALARLAGTKRPRGPVAVVRIPSERLDPNRNLLVSVGVSDPGNVGTMIRTAASFGWGYAYTDGSADPWAPKTIRGGAGGQFQTPVSRLETLEELTGWTVVATVANKGEPPEAVTERPVALLMGEEAHGIPQSIVDAAPHRLTIPTTGATESLNVAVAAGIAVYELSKPDGLGPGRV